MSSSQTKYDSSYQNPQVLRLKKSTYETRSRIRKCNILITWRGDLGVCGGGICNLSDSRCSICDWLCDGWNWRVFSVCIISIIIIWCSFFYSRLDDFCDSWMDVFFLNCWSNISCSVSRLSIWNSWTHDLGNSCRCVVCISIMIMSFGWTFGRNRSTRDSYSENCSENLTRN